MSFISNVIYLNINLIFSTLNVFISFFIFIFCSTGTVEESVANWHKNNVQNLKNMLNYIKKSIIPFFGGWWLSLQSSPVPFSAEAPLLRIWMARRMSRLKRATAAALSHSPSCSRDFRKGSTSMSGPRLIQPHSCRARLRSSLWYHGTSVCLSEPDQQRRVSVVPERETFL